MTGPFSLANYVAQTDDVMRKGLIMKVTNESVFMRILTFIPVVTGFAYEYAEQSKLPAVSFRALNAPYTPDTGVVNPKSEMMRPLGGLVQVDRLLVRGGSPARSNAILAKTRAAALLYDATVINGNPEAGSAHVTEFYGLRQRLTGNQLLTMGANGGNLTRDKVDQLLDSVAGPNTEKVLVMNKNVRRQLKAQVLSGATGAGVLDVTGSLASYDGATIEVLDEDGAEVPILDFNETQGTYTTATSMYCVRPGHDAEGEWVQGLIGGNVIEHEDHGIRGTMYEDLIEMLGGLAVFHGRAAARLAGIKKV